MNAGRRGMDRERHLDTAVLLDYLEGRLDGPARGRVEEHGLQGAEHGRVAADPERQDEHGRPREDG